jgi:hypothetical protein
MVYWDSYLNIPSLNVDPEYYFEVAAFSSGTPRYVENTFETRGRGAELQFTRRPTEGSSTTEYVMTYETYGKDEVYVFNDIMPGTYTLTHRYGVGIWGPQQLTEEQLIGTGAEPTYIASNLTQFGIGSTKWGTIEVRVYPGETSGRVEVILKYDTAFTAAYSNGTIKVNANTEVDDNSEFKFIVAVYDKEGKYVYSETSDLFTSYGAAWFNVSKYPRGEYNYKVFCWDEDYIPLFESLLID